MKNFKKHRNSQERRTEIEQRIKEVEAELVSTKSDILRNVLPLKLFRSWGGNIKPMPIKVGAQLLATRMVSNSHPLIKVATPLVTNSFFNKVSETESQQIILSKAHRFFSWVAAKTKLSLREEQQLLSAEIPDVSLSKEVPFVGSKNVNLEELEKVFTSPSTIDAEKVSLY